MAEFGPDIAADVLAACQQNAAQAAESIAMLCEAEFTLTPGETADLDAANLPSDGGLLLLFEVGQHAAALLWPESTGLLPAWYAEEDASRQEQLNELAGMLGKLLLPKDFLPTRCEALVADDFAKMLQKGELAKSAVCLPLAVDQEGEAKGAMQLVWPLVNAAALLPEESESAKAVIDGEPAAQPATVSTTASHIHSITELPGYAQSLLRIRVPVIAVLARSKQRVSDLLEMGPGSIIQFDKSCEQLLELQAGEQLVARGEAVKVGEKFGLRIQQIVLPEERFKKVM